MFSPIPKNLFKSPEILILFLLEEPMSRLNYYAISFHLNESPSSRRNQYGPEMINEEFAVLKVSDLLNTSLMAAETWEHSPSTRKQQSKYAESR